MSNTFEFDSTAASKAAAALDGIADRLTTELTAVAPTLRVAPAGTDEVSTRAATTANGVAEDYLSGAEAGAREMSKLAATLRAQVAEFDQMETDNTSGFAGPAV
ncbi:PE family protein [Nocardia mangyaensis]|uniref:PE family protein n=1 Tax=Nocardia mangyaensis TaxID=2213200 RepID=UPI0026746A9B|nr:PE family protein [Nocardia mangyaensis]MDO3647286.1 PE family protein [Nocardia mangyaensis]